MKIENKSIEEILKHSLYYSRYNTIGLLIGDSTSVKRAISLSHTPINTCILETYLEIVNSQLLNDKEEILGFYEVRDDFYDENNILSDLFKTIVKSYSSSIKKEILALSLVYQNENFDVKGFKVNKSFTNYELDYSNINRLIENIKNKYFNYSDLEDKLNNH